MTGTKTFGDGSLAGIDGDVPPGCLNVVVSQIPKAVGFIYALVMIGVIAYLWFFPAAGYTLVVDESSAIFPAPFLV
jgi:hypothetical protein